MHSEVKNGSALSKGEKVGTVKKQKAGKLEEKFQALTQEGARGSSGVGVALPAENADASRDRRPLESYFQEIGSTRTLKREEEVFLAKELDLARHETIFLDVGQDSRISGLQFGLRDALDHINSHCFPIDINTRFWR